MKVGDWIVSAGIDLSRPEPELLWLAAEILEDLRGMPWANCFRAAQVMEPKFIFGATERTHKVWKTREERAEEELTKL